MKRWILKGALIASALWTMTAAHALTVQEARGIAVGDSDARVQALAQAVAQAHRLGDRIGHTGLQSGPTQGATFTLSLP